MCRNKKCRRLRTETEEVEEKEETASGMEKKKCAEKYKQLVKKELMSMIMKKKKMLS